MTDPVLNPAEQAANRALERMYACIDNEKDFLLEAGAGAGKTYSLVHALQHLIKKRGSVLLRQHQQVACISYTNVASDEIASRIDRHPAIHSSTIHSFCWAIIKGFQPYLREKLSTIDYWTEKLAESGETVGQRKINYDEFGHPGIRETHISLRHDDILIFFVKLMEYKKFRALLVGRFPILLIDEYQDTNKELTQALKRHFLDTGEGPLLGFFGDHWQKIYRDTCGKIASDSLEVIGKESNFRSVKAVVDVLNKMRPELPQNLKDPNAEGIAVVYHTNGWVGQRRTGAHWSDDLPANVAHQYLTTLRRQLASEGWDFAPDKTKILMLTHNLLAAEQGYINLANVFPYNDTFIKKEDPHIKFFVEALEPACIAYENKHFGEMFKVLQSRTPAIHIYSDKINWRRDMDNLLTLRANNKIGAVLDLLLETDRPRLPESVQKKEQQLRQVQQQGASPEAEIPESIERLRQLREVDYQEVIALSSFVNEQTPFSTKHGVKGAEFENVLVVLGRGWNQYNFNQFLEWAGDRAAIPEDKLDAFERNRNLFYVTCSRPKKRLALLFTQKLSNQALATLSNWFGTSAVKPMRIDI